VRRENHRRGFGGTSSECQLFYWLTLKDQARGKLVSSYARLVSLKSDDIYFTKYPSVLSVLQLIRINLIFAVSDILNTIF